MYVGSDLLVSSGGVLISLPILFMFIRATASFFDPIMILTQIMASMQQAQASAERIIGLIEEKPTITDSEDVVLKYGDTLNPKYDKFRSEERRVGKECRSRWLTYH